MTPEDGGRRRNQLGRGLSALFGEEIEAVSAPGEAGPRMMSIDCLSANPAQPRRLFDEEELESLAQSVREKGVLQPLLVRPAAGQPGHFQIVAGERRWRAAQRAQRHEVPVIVREIDDGEALQLAIIENVQRQDLSPIEEAEGYQRLLAEFGFSQDALARVVSKSRSHIANTVRLLSLPETVRDQVGRGGLSAGHARALLSCPDIEGAARTVVERGLNVRQTEELVRQSSAPSRQSSHPKASRTIAPGRDADVVAIEDELSSRLGLRVSIRSGQGQQGTLAIHYKTLEQLDVVLQRLSQTPAMAD